MMKKRKIAGMVKILVLGVFVFSLMTLVCETGYTIISTSVAEQVKIDKKTSKYISFNYAENDKNIIKVENPKIMGDFRGRRLREDYFDFEVGIDKKFVKSGSVEYEIVAIPIGNVISEEYIKFYLTDQNNESMVGYKDVVPLFSMFSDDIDGKVIYKGKFNKKNTNDKYRLRIWVSEDYKEKVDSGLTYKVEVRIKQ